MIDEAWDVVPTLPLCGFGYAAAVCYTDGVAVEGPGSGPRSTSYDFLKVELGADDDDMLAGVAERRDAAEGLEDCGRLVKWLKNKTVTVLGAGPRSQRSTTLTQNCQMVGCAGAPGRCREAALAPGHATLR